jgi:hypothetical protein
LNARQNRRDRPEKTDLEKTDLDLTVPETRGRGKTIGIVPCSGAPRRIALRSGVTGIVRNEGTAVEIEIVRVLSAIDLRDLSGIGPRARLETDRPARPGIGPRAHLGIGLRDRGEIARPGRSEIAPSGRSATDPEMTVPETTDLEMTVPAKTGRDLTVRETTVAAATEAEATNVAETGPAAFVPVETAPETTGRGADRPAVARPEADRRSRSGIARPVPAAIARRVRSGSAPENATAIKPKGLFPA